MRHAALALAGLACACALAGPARAQRPPQPPKPAGRPRPAEPPKPQQPNPAEQVARGIRAYRNLDYDSASVLLQAALTQPDSLLADSDRVRGLVYLGASELYRERRDSAASLFGRLLRLDPRYHIDQLVFPPEITGLFQQVRLVTRAVAVVVPPDAELRAASDAFPIWLYASTFHPVDVTVLRRNGTALRTVYKGGVGDSLQLRWDGRAADGSPPDSGHYILRVDSHGSDGKVVRSVALPLDISRDRRDTLRLPAPLADSLFKAEYSPGGNGHRALATGLVAAVAATLIPAIVAGKFSPSPDRLTVAWGFGLAGFLGYRVDRQPRPIQGNITANRNLRTGWQRQVDSLHAENLVRQHEVRILIHAGASQVVAAP